MSFSDWSSDLCSSDLYCSHAHFNAAIRRRIKAGGCGRENNSAAVDDFDIPVALAAHARTLRQRADTLHRRINLAPVPDHERELVVTAGKINDGNPGNAPSDFGSYRFFPVCKALACTVPRFGFPPTVDFARPVKAQ